MVLEAEHLTVRLPEGGAAVFEDRSLALREGGTHLLLGGAGTGKTALGVTLCGYLPLWTGSWSLDGTVRFNGAPLVQGESSPDIGIVLDNPYSQLSGMKRTVRHELAFPLESRGIERSEMNRRIEELSGIFGLPRLLDRDLKLLSGGELQRVVIASALISNPRMLFLDRPMTEIDDDFRPPLLSIIGERLSQAAGGAVIAEDPWLLPETEGMEHTLLGASMPESVVEPIPLPPASGGGELLRVESLVFGYCGAEPLIDGLSFSLAPGSLTFVTGRNGAGKTTLARLIAGIRRPDDGKILIEGRDASVLDAAERFSRIGYAHQNPDYFICRSSVRGEMELAARWGYPPGPLTGMLGLGGLLDRHPLELTQAEKKRLGLALTCGGDRRVLILDEPTQYQDGNGFRMVAETIARWVESGKAVMVITHDPRFFKAFPGAELIRLARGDSP